MILLLKNCQLERLGSSMYGYFNRATAIAINISLRHYETMADVTSSQCSELRRVKRNYSKEPNLEEYAVQFNSAETN